VVVIARYDLTESDLIVGARNLMTWNRRTGMEVTKPKKTETVKTASKPPIGEV